MYRRFSANELNQLLKSGIDPYSLDLKSIGETPVEYIVKKAEFFEREFYVDKSVLIPRIETEELVKLGLKALKSFKNDSITFADVGCGSGAIGITFASELALRNIPFEGYLSDLSDKAVEITKKNIDNIFHSKNENCFTSKINVASKLKTIESDLMKSFPKRMYGKFDILFANLPYIPTDRIASLSSSVKDFEPIMALDGGIDGLDLIESFLNQAKAYIKKSGIIFLEVDDTHTEKIFEIKSHLLVDWNIKIKKDLNDKNRFWIVKPRE